MHKVTVLVIFQIWYIWVETPHPWPWTRATAPRTLCGVSCVGMPWPLCIVMYVTCAFVMTVWRYIRPINPKCIPWCRWHNTCPLYNVPNVPTTQTINVNSTVKTVTVRCVYSALLHIHIIVVLACHQGKLSSLTIQTSYPSCQHILHLLFLFSPFLIQFALLSFCNPEESWKSFPHLLLWPFPFILFSFLFVPFLCSSYLFLPGPFFFTPPPLSWPLSFSHSVPIYCHRII